MTGLGVHGHVDVVHITAKVYVGPVCYQHCSRNPCYALVMDSDLLYSTSLSEKYCEPSVTSDGNSAKKSLKEFNDMHVDSLGGGCVYISICSMYERGIEKRGMKKISVKERGGAHHFCCTVGRYIF